MIHIREPNGVLGACNRRIDTQKEYPQFLEQVRDIWTGSSIRRSCEEKGNREGVWTIADAPACQNT